MVWLRQHFNQDGWPTSRTRDGLAEVPALGRPPSDVLQLFDD